MFQVWSPEITKIIIFIVLIEFYLYDALFVDPAGSVSFRAKLGP